MAASPQTPRPTPPQALVVAVVIAVVLATGSAMVLRTDQRPGPGPGPSPSAAADSPLPSPTPGGGGDWAALEVGELPVSATLEADRRDPAGIAPDTSFTLVSRSDEPAVAIAARLQFSPAATYKVVASTDGRTATLTPDHRLAAGRTYRVGLSTTDAAAAGSWAFHVRGPVMVVSTIPGDATTAVPVTTGVEVTFDQDGVAAMDDHFAIAPAVTGRFERHGRTQVFVPDRLAPATMYTVTIRRGLGRTGTDLTLPADVVLRFETAGDAVSEARLQFSRDVIEVSPKERPVIAVTDVSPDSDEGAATPPPKTAKVKVYRLVGLDAAGRTLSAFLAAPRWGDFTDPLMPTKGLAVAATFEAKVDPFDGDTLLLRFPITLPEGRYIVELPGARRSHAFLQVTPISAWVSVSTDRTAVWLNDVTTGHAVPSATVRVEGGASLGRANSDGLLIARTPADLVPPPAADPEAAVPPVSPVLRATSPAGKVVLIPFGVQGAGEGYRGEWSEKSPQADTTYWAVMATDRGIYRRDDKIQVWGYLRGRDDGVVPSPVTVRLVTQGGGRTPGAPTVANVNVRPGSDGSFIATLPVDGLPLGGYEVQAVVDDRLIVSRFVEVTVIRKPPYALTLESDRHALLAGDSVTLTTAAAFFDGSPVPSLGVLFHVDPEGDGRPATTDASGGASLSFAPQSDSPTEDAASLSFGITPSGPEGADIGASQNVLVFPSAYDLQASGEVRAGRLRIDVSLHAIDLGKVEKAMSAGRWDGDAAGAAAAAKHVAASIVELVPVRHRVGSDYDFVDKVVKPRYEYDIVRKPVASRALVTGADGHVRFDLAVPNADHDYEISLSATDDQGRLQQRTVTAGQPFAFADTGVVFETATGTPVGDQTYRIGDPVTWRMASAGTPFPSGGGDRYLYLVSQRGLRAATVSSSPTFRHTFAAADAPGVFVIGVRFTGSTYAPKAASWANFDQRERALKVTVAADHDRFRPGETVTLSVHTTDASGAPVAASVVVQAVDEKLYAIGGASIAQPLDELYQRVDSGILRLTATHQVPSMAGGEGEGGDTTGGGRSDFKDTLLFREIQTDATGRATTTVKLSDDLTSWHVAASAVTADLKAGVGELLVPVGLPFFAEATLADTYLVTDRPVIRLRAFGDGLRVGDPVEFTVEAPSLGLAPTRITGTAFAPTSVPLPVASVGRGSVVVGATATSRTGSDGQPLTDRLTRTFDVIASRLTTVRTAYGTGRDLPSLGEASGLTTYTFTDAGRGVVLPVLLDLAEPAGPRIDQGLAQSMADRLLIDAFGRAPATLPPLDFEPSRYPLGDDSDGTTHGLGLLPWSSLDPWLAARVALTSPDALDREALRSTLLATLRASTTRRDLAIATLAGLAAMDEPVLAELVTAAAEPDLSTIERLYLGLAFAAAGDQPAATAIERDLLRKAGEHLGPWVRLTSTDREATLEATSLLGILAAEVGDPLAAGLARYVIDNPSAESIHDLDLAAWAGHVLEHTPATTASFSYTVDGSRTEVTLKPGEAVTIALTEAQRPTLGIEPGSGQVGITVEARVAVAPSTLVPYAGLSLARATPASPVSPDRIVVVELTPGFTGNVPVGCYDVTELVPSGLAPLADGYWEDSDPDVTWPTSVVGQEVRFCADYDPKDVNPPRLRYRARVVNEGSFSWEPAVMQLPGAPELLAVTPATTLVVGAP